MMSKMKSAVHFIKGLIIFLRSCFAGICFLHDMLRYKGNVNEKRLTEVRQDERDISGKIVIVTGSNSGIGKQTTLELARRGAKVIMACRDLKRAEGARQDILKEVPKAQLDVMQVDMSDLESIRSFARQFKSRYNHLDVLVNNAGIWSHDMTTTKDGFESHIGTNYLGTFLLTLLVLDSLLKAENGRIVFLSSSTITMETLDLDNLTMKDQQQGILTAYANSKLCLAMFSKQLAKLLTGTNVTTYALCTGMVKTNITRDMISWSRVLVDKLFSWTVSLPIEEGTATVVHCVLSTSLSEESGRFYRYLAEWKPADEVIQRHSRQKLWELSENLVGLGGFANNFNNQLTSLD